MGTGFYDAIYYSTAEKLAQESGRRALLVFSDGEDNSSSHDMMTTMEDAQSDNVLVYTIRYTDEVHGQLTARNKYGIRVMDRIAKETGGTAIDAEKTDPHKDDTFRKIVIHPKQAGLTVRAKTGYFSRSAKLCAREVGAFRGVHPDLFTFVDEGRHLHHQPGFRLGRLGDAAGRRRF